MLQGSQALTEKVVPCFATMTDSTAVLCSFQTYETHMGAQILSAEAPPARPSEAANGVRILPSPDC